MPSYSTTQLADQPADECNQIDTLQLHLLEEAEENQQHYERYTSVTMVPILLFNWYVLYIEFYCTLYDDEHLSLFTDDYRLAKDIKHLPSNGLGPVKQTLFAYGFLFFAEYILRQLLRERPKQAIVENLPDELNRDAVGNRMVALTNSKFELFDLGTKTASHALNHALKSLLLMGVTLTDSQRHLVLRHTLLSMFTHLADMHLHFRLTRHELLQIRREISAHCLRLFEWFSDLHAFTIEQRILAGHAHIRLPYLELKYTGTEAEATNNPVTFIRDHFTKGGSNPLQWPALTNGESTRMLLQPWPNSKRLVDQQIDKVRDDLRVEWRINPR